MKRKIFVVVLTIILFAGLTACFEQTQTGFVENEDVKYTLFIGLNDKDTYAQEISIEEAEKKVTEIALKYVDGFTQSTAKGAYKDDKDIVTYENSLVFTFNFATEEQIKKIMDEVLVELNQNSILIEKQIINYDFYEGENI